MAGKIRLKMNSAGARELLKSDAVARELRGRAEAVAAAARAGGGKYMVTVHYGKNRIRVSVITADQDARKAEAENRTLSRALQAARTQ